MRPVTILIPLLVTACGTPNLQLDALALPPQRIQQNGYSLVPLAEPDWFVAIGQPESLSLVRFGAQPDEKYMARAYRRGTTNLSGDANLARFADAVLYEKGPTGAKVLRQDSKVVRIKNQRCVRVSSTLADSPAGKGTDGRAGVHTDVRAIVCEHPGKTSAVVVVYSYSRTGEARDSALDAKADKLFGSIEFTTPRKPTRG